ncbi:MAG: DUF3108 domain-containing protein [Bacillota bacterium]
MRKAACLALLAVVLLLFGCASTKPLAGLVIPYGDNERLTYDFLVNGQKVAEAQFYAKKDQIEQQMAWLLSMDLKAGDQAEINEVWTDLATLKPYYSRIQLTSPQGSYDIKTRYSDKVVSLEAETPQGKQQAERKISGVIYDNAQILMTLRALPIANDYQTKLSFVQTKNLSRGEMIVKVVGNERVQVPAGEFECYKVEMSIQGARQSVWYSTDAKHWLVRYDNGQSQFVLRRLS